MHTHTLILLERLSSLTMSTTCTKNSEARTAKNPQSWTIESNLSRHCKKACRWFLNEFDMRVNSRRGALLPTMSVTVSMTDETPKCFICLPGAHRNVPSVRSLAWNDFFVCGKQLPCQRISAFDAQEAAFSSIPALEPSSERWRWGLGCHTSRRQALGEKTQNKTLAMVSLYSWSSSVVDTVWRARHLHLCGVS